MLKLELLIMKLNDQDHRQFERFQQDNKVSFVSSLLLLGLIVLLFLFIVVNQEGFLHLIGFPEEQFQILNAKWVASSVKTPLEKELLDKFLSISQVLHSTAKAVIMAIVMTSLFWLALFNLQSLGFSIHLRKIFEFIKKISE